MAKTDRKKEYKRLLATGRIQLIEGIPVRVPRGDIAAAQKQSAQIRKQLKGMMESGDPWKMKKAKKWAHLVRPRKYRPFWKRALEDVNVGGNIFRGLFTKTKNGWFGRVAEFTKIVAAGPTLTGVTKALASQLKTHLKDLDAQCDDNQKNDGVLVGIRPDGQVAVWIGEMSKLK